jgi:hypothetical protein
MEIYRRTIEEIIVRYELEPSLRDIYVEGLEDKSLIEWFLSQHGQTNCAIYDVDTIEIPAELLFAENLVDGNRSRVIFLALYTCRFYPNQKALPA